MGVRGLETGRLGKELAVLHLSPRVIGSLPQQVHFLNKEWAALFIYLFFLEGGGRLCKKDIKWLGSRVWMDFDKQIRCLILMCVFERSERYSR